MLHDFEALKFIIKFSESETFVVEVGVACEDISEGVWQDFVGDLRGLKGVKVIRVV